MSKKPQTNVQFVKQIMEYSKHGALMQAFVMTALEHYADQCIEAGAEALNSGLVSGEAWIGCAKEMKAGIDQHFERT